MNEEIETKAHHKVEVVEVNLEKLANSDHLSIVRVYGFTVVTRTEGWKEGQLGVYIPPDSLVPVNRPEFTFLAPDAKEDGKARIKAKKLRGVLSFGLLVAAPDGAKIGDDLKEAWEVEHYVPGCRQTNFGKSQLFPSGEVSEAPNVPVVKYDVDAGRRYAKAFFPGEPVVVSEKCHGASARFVFHNGKMYVGSRTEWKKE